MCHSHVLLLRTLTPCASAHSRIAVTPPQISYAMSDETATVSTVAPNARPVVIATTMSSAVIAVQGYKNIRGLVFSFRHFLTLDHVVDQVGNLVKRQIP